jgi:transposase
MGHYVGMDVGLRSSSLCIIDEQGKVCLECEVASAIVEIAAAIRGFAEHVDGVALETGNLTSWLTTGLRAEGFRVVVMEARQVKTTLSSLRNKTDRSDARGIAQILRTGWYREVHVKSFESQRLKTLLAARKALLRRRIDLENEVRGLLKVYGLKLPPQIYHARFDDMARQAVVADPALAEALGPLLDARGHLYRAFLDIDKRVRALAHDDPICQLLMSAPGVGFVAALTFKAAVDDPSRFRRSKTVAAISVSPPDAISRGRGTIPATYRRPAMSRFVRRCSWRPTRSLTAGAKLHPYAALVPGWPARRDANARWLPWPVNLPSCSTPCGPMAPCSATSRRRCSPDDVIA